MIDSNVWATLWDTGPTALKRRLLDRPPAGEGHTNGPRREADYLSKLRLGGGGCLICHTAKRTTCLISQATKAANGEAD